MSAFYPGLVLFLLLLMAAGAVRVLRGPSRSDRVLAVQFLATVLVAVLLVLAQAGGGSALRDAALVVAVLATVNVVAFVRSEGGGR